MTILLTESMTLGESWHEFTEEMKQLGDPMIWKTLALEALLYFIIWTFMIKTGIVTNHKKLGKAKAAKRTIEARFTREKVKGKRRFCYRYIHPLNGEEKKYIIKIPGNRMPPEKTTLYYDEAGKVFEEKATGKAKAYLIVFVGIILPIMLAGFFLQFI